jgi:hypothetical protein
VQAEPEIEEILKILRGRPIDDAAMHADELAVQEIVVEGD